MASEISKNLARGVIFGGALTAAEVWSPTVIVDQMTLHDFHMLKVFLSANVVSGLLFPLFANSKSINTTPRSASNLGWLFPYDGNILGGALLGAGMALTGACPGTVFAQVGAHVPSALPVLAGGILGGIVYARAAPHLQTAAARAQTQDPTRLTLHGRWATDAHLTLFGVEAALIAVITAVAKLQQQPPGQPPRVLDPVLAGVLIGCAQLASLLLARMPLGISGAYEEAGRWTWYLLDRARALAAGARYQADADQTKAAPPRPAHKHIVFGAGIIAGTVLLRALRPEFAIADDAVLPLWRSLAGGFALVFGSRLAGGCTSGHGLSGAALLSVSSFISVGAMFAGGIAFAKLFL